MEEVKNTLLRKRRYLDKYLLGFADAEGCFSVAIKRQAGTKFGLVVDPLFQVTQHKNNMIVLELFRKVFSCGRIIEKSGQKDLAVFLVDNRRQLIEKIIPFFEKNKPLLKHGDFLKFKEIVIALENKEHVTKQGLEKLIKLAYRMNLEGKQRRRKLEEVLSELM